MEIFLNNTLERYQIYCCHKMIKIVLSEKRLKCLVILLLVATNKFIHMFFCGGPLFGVEFDAFI